MAEKSKLNVKVFKRLLSYWKSYKTLFSIAVVCTLLLAILGPVRPKVVGYMVNEYIVLKKDYGMLLTWTLVIIGMLV